VRPIQVSDAPPAIPTVTPAAGPRPVRLAMAGLDSAAPAVAARIADYLWFRLPPRPSAARRERFTPPGGRPFVVRRRDLEVTGMVFGPEGAPTAHLVHGWAGWWQQLAAHVPALLDAGYRVVAHDAPSHGSSRPGRHGPRSTTLLEIADAFTAVVHQQGPADLVVAHSLGATATMWASRHGTVAGAYAFLAPMASLVPMLDWFEHVIGLGPATRPRLVDRVERRVGVPLTEFDIT